MGAPQRKLSEKHWQAIKLLEDGSLSRKEIAARIGVTLDYFNDLCAGNIEKAGYTADLFKKELRKVGGRRDETTKAIISENMALAQEQINRILKEFKAKKKLSLDDKKLIASLTNTLTRSTQHVEIGTLSYSYTKGLTAEELIHEFTRLKSIAEISFERSGNR